MSGNHELCEFLKHQVLHFCGNSCLHILCSFYKNLYCTDFENFLAFCGCFRRFCVIMRSHGEVICNFLARQIGAEILKM